MIRRSQRRRVVRFAAATIGLLILGWYHPGIFLRPIAWGLYRHDHPAKNADAVILLMGEPAVRPMAAARAITEGFASKLIYITPQSNPLEDAGWTPSEDNLTMKVLQSQGLQLAQIVVLSEFGRATSTVDEAIALRQYLQRRPSTIRRLIVVTSWPHSSRAGWIFEQAMDGLDVKIEVLPVEWIPFSRDDWWRTEGGLLFVFEEYVKYARYYVKYWGRDLH